MLKLYAQAMLYKPQAEPYEAGFALPKLPETVLTKTLTINSKHCDQYNKLSEWQNGIAALIHPSYVQTLSLSMQLEMMVTEPFPFIPEQNATLELSTRFGKVYYHRRGWMFEVTTSAFVGAEQALTGTSYYLARKHHSAELAKHYQDNACALPDWITGIGHTELTHNIASDNVLFTANIGRRYAKVSGDYNPIHLYPYTAKLLGFKKAIAHGMYSKALAVSKIAQQQGFYKSNFCVKVVFMQPIMLPLETQLITSTQDTKSDSAPVLYFSLNSQKGNKKRAHLVGTISKLS
jgi:hypothetical protein